MGFLYKMQRKLALCECIIAIIAVVFFYSITSEYITVQVGPGPDSRFRHQLEILNDFRNNFIVFHIIIDEQLEGFCDFALSTIQSIKDFSRDNFNKYSYGLFWRSHGEFLKVFEDMCTNGTWVRDGILMHRDCFQRLEHEINFCKENFLESAKLLSSADITEGRKVHQECCGIDWRRNCFSKAAKMECSDEASDFMYNITTGLVGSGYDDICKLDYPLCHGLYGMSPDTLDDSLSYISKFLLIFSYFL